MGGCLKCSSHTQEFLENHANCFTAKIWSVKWQCHYVLMDITYMLVEKITVFEYNGYFCLTSSELLTLGSDLASSTGFFLFTKREWFKLTKLLERASHDLHYYIFNFNLNCKKLDVSVQIIAVLISVHNYPVILYSFFQLNYCWSRNSIIAFF